jgi:hypothetical protein
VNKYLEKIAADKEKKYSVRNSAIAGGLLGANVAGTWSISNQFKEDLVDWAKRPGSPDLKKFPNMKPFSARTLKAAGKGAAVLGSLGAAEAAIRNRFQKKK